MAYLIDKLQYANWSETIFRQMRVGRWSKAMDYGEGSADAPSLPDILFGAQRLASVLGKE
jgi:hypothetical protein